MPKEISRVYAFVIFVIFSSIVFSASSATKGNYYLSGIVRDAKTLEPLPFASVTVSGDANGALSNEQGIFELTVADEDAELIVTCLGYERKAVPIKKGACNLYDVHLSPSATQLKEVVIKRKKYSKKNNPAVDLAKRLRSGRDITDPRRRPYYNYDKHELINIAINEFDDYGNSSLLKKFPFLTNYVDTSEISGKSILNVMVKERTSQVHYRKDPHSEKEVVTGFRQDGIDEVGSQDNVTVFLEDILREIDLYDNDINLLQNRFVSPLSRIAPDFYKFYLTDTVEVGGEKCIVLSFYPHNTASFGFNGQVFVPVNDSTM